MKRWNSLIAASMITFVVTTGPLAFAEDSIMENLYSKEQMMSDLGVADSEFKKSPIEILVALRVEVTYYFVSRGGNCTIGDPGAIFLATSVTKPDGSSSPFLTLNVTEVIGGTNCNGSHSGSKEGRPLGDGPGQYKISLKSNAAHWGIAMNRWPRIRMWADKNLVVDATFSSNGLPTLDISDEWIINFTPNKIVPMSTFVGNG